MEIYTIAQCITLGFSFSFIMQIVGMSYGEEGVRYYGEIHTMFLNRLIHCMFMPFTMYGVLLFVPNLIFYNNLNKINKLKRMTFVTYIAHYATFDVVGAILTAIYTLPITYFAIKHQDKVCYQNMMKGFAISFGALIIQEIFGHYISGDKPSRFEAIPNAIIYAPYFAINELF